MAEYPFTPLAGKPQRKKTGILICVAIILYFVLGGIGIIVAWGTFAISALTRGEVAGFPIFFVCFPAYVLATFLLWPMLERYYKLGLRLQKVDAITLLSQDSRDPVLFLRSFRDDDLPDVGAGGLWVSTVEETLERHFSPIGPVIAIGRPGEAHPELGAARFYVSDDEWKIAVEYFLQRAAAVVLLMGATQGVLWEVDRALNSIPPEELLLCFPFILPSEKRSWWLPAMRHVKNFQYGTALVETMRREREQRYQLFRMHMEEQTPMKLPESPGDTIFIDFLADGTFRLLPSIPPARALSLYAQREKQFVALPDYERTLRPFFEKFLHRKITPPLLERILTQEPMLWGILALMSALMIAIQFIPIRELACIKLFCCQATFLYAFVIALYIRKRRRSAVHG